MDRDKHAYMGIDPGLYGAVAVIYDGGARVEDTPIDTPPFGRKDYNIPAMLNLLCELDKEYIIEECWIEDVHSRPGDGHVGAFSFGRGVGIWHGLLAACKIIMKKTTPITWKKEMGLIGMGKDGSRAEAMYLFPSLEDKLSRAKDHDRAEALLIAEYGRRRKQQ